MHSKQKNVSRKLNNASRCPQKQEILQLGGKILARAGIIDTQVEKWLRP